MGIANTLFFSANAEGETLHRRITPADHQFELQQERWNALAAHLRADMRAKAECSVNTWLQGSYKFATQVRPARKSEEFDIDLGFYFMWPGNPQDGRHSPQELRLLVQNSIKEFGAKTEDVREVAEPKPRCCRIHYQADFHVDVPCYHLDAARNARSLATKDGWEASDPKAFYTWFKDQFEETERTRVRRQIRYLKAWAGLRFAPNGRPSSVVLTTLVSDAVLCLSREERASADDDLLHLVLGRIRSRLATSMEVWNPVERTENMNRLSREQALAFRTAVRAFHGIAEEAVGADDELAAADIWSRAFEYFFPMPAIQAAVVNGSGSAHGQVMTAMADTACLPNVVVTVIPDANTNLARTSVNEVSNVPRNSRIHFELERPNSLPPGTSVEWMARNQGAEAEGENDMGHRGGTDFVWNDRAAYAGNHFMDVTFRQDGRIVGLRRVPVGVTGIPAPKRNPPKPSWVALRGRR